MTDPKERFSGRVENYVRYRPGYPQTVLDLLRSECRLTSNSVVADVASGTGLLSELFLENANRVYGVEPNAEMREAGERRLECYDRFTSVAGSAEETPLEAGSVDFVVVGQAFHWFDLDAARAEFVRVLRPGGWVALLWNEMREGATPFMEVYERLIREYKTEEYKQFDLPREVRSFFGPGAFEAGSFE
ncbi:MAG: class I SAM-dependent methyltransferase, partial [Actinomycetota bacterium]|nr:class I SAM-dependent methyltransferase [Actinomycetota bacterium]